MNPSVPGDDSADGKRPQPVPLPPIRYDLAAMLKENPWLCRVLKITRVSPEYLGLKLNARAAFDFSSFSLFVQIDCVNALDYSIRPPNPGILGGGPLMEFHEQHQLLENISQVVPNSDGMEMYDPPVKFGLLLIDQSYVIAGQFALSFEDVNGFKDVWGIDDRQRQRYMANFQRGLEWMEPFRLAKLKRFPTRVV